MLHRITPSLAIFLLAMRPSLARAAGEGGAPSLPSLALRATGSLIAVLFLIGALGFFLRRLRESPPMGRRRAHLACLERLDLGGRREIRLLEVAGRRLLVGVTPESTTLLAEWPSPPGEELTARERAPAPILRVLEKLTTSSRPESIR